MTRDTRKLGPSQHGRGARVLVASAALLVALAGCAPEAGNDEIPRGEGGFTSEADQGESWPERMPEEEAPKNTEPPESFPLESSLIPEGAVIDDVGERAPGEWFVVMSANDTAAASQLLDSIIASGEYVVTDEGATSEGERYATLEGQGLIVDALILASADGEPALLSLDILAMEE